MVLNMPIARWRYTLAESGSASSGVVEKSEMMLACDRRSVHKLSPFSPRQRADRGISYHPVADHEADWVHS